MGEKYISKIAQGDNTYYIKDLNAVSGSSLTSNNIIIGGGNSSVSASGKSIETSLTANSDNTVPTSKAVATYVATNIANATRYKGGFNANSSNGTIDGGDTTLKSVKEVIGDMYTVTTAGTFLGQSLEVGDSIIFKADVAAGTAPIASNVVFVEGTTSVSVPSTTPTLSWGQTSTIGTVEGVDLKITMPSAISVMGASGSNHASGLVPDTPSTAGTTKFLREDGTWAEPSVGSTVTGETVHYLTNVSGTAAVTTDPYTAAKWVGTADGVTSLYDGLMITIKVPVAGNATYGTTLNINNIGEHPVLANASTAIGTRYAVDCIITLIYDADATGNAYQNGSTATTYTGCWKKADYDTNTTYSNAKLGQGYATCATAEATTAKVATLSSYSLTAGGIVTVKFTYDVPANATLSINNLTAKAIYHKGAKIKAGVIKAGDFATFIYSSYYHLISLNRNFDDTFGASGSNHASGLVPDPGATAGTTKFLREDGTWNEPPCVGEPLPNVYIGEPSTSAARMIYFNTTTSKFYQRDNNNTSWEEIPTLPKAVGYDISADQTYEIINGVMSQTAYDWTSNLWYVDYTGDWDGQIGVPIYYESGYFAPYSYYYGSMPSSSTIAKCLNSVALPTGCATRTNLSDIYTGYRMCVATISTNQSTVSVLGGVSNLKAGYELHVIVKATAAVTITLPTSSPYVLCGDDSALSLANGDIAEINFISDGTNIYVRSIV